MKHALPALTALVLAAPAGAQAARHPCGDAPYPTGQIACFRDASQEANDPHICLEAAASDVAFNCLGLFAEAAGDPAACSLIAEMPEDGTEMLIGACVGGVAVATGDPALCDTIADAGLAQACRLLVADPPER